MVCAVVLPAAAEETPTTLRKQIEVLAARHGVAVRGLDKIGATEPARADSGDVASRIAALLAEYSHMVITDTDGRVVRLVISGRRHSGPPPEALVSVALEPGRAGHFVTAEITGPAGGAHRVKLVVDTGASICVLPARWKATLGYGRQPLKTVTLQTAGGRIEGERAMLPALRVGHARAANVEVAFVDGDRLGVSGLLGRSFLARYATTIDLDANRLTLERRGP